MVVQNNVIRFEPSTWYCMRQCKESINWCKAQKDPKYDVEIKGEEEILRIFMNETLERAA